MTRSASNIYVPQGALPTPSARGAADFLRSNENLAGILPLANRMAALQSDCAAALPAMFNACAVLQFTSDRLLLSAPNGALASKLKQQLPKLQDHLIRRGWQVNAILLKVQVGNDFEKPAATKRLALPQQALFSFAALDQTLEKSPRNEALRASIAALLQRHASRNLSR